MFLKICILWVLFGLIQTCYLERDVCIYLYTCVWLDKNLFVLFSLLSEKIKTFAVQAFQLPLNRIIIWNSSIILYFSQKSLQEQSIIYVLLFAFIYSKKWVPKTSNQANMYIDIFLAPLLNASLFEHGTTINDFKNWYTSSWQNFYGGLISIVLEHVIACSLNLI